MAERVRNKKITFYFDESEYEIVRFKMEQMGITNLSHYLRKMALEGMMYKVDYSVFDEIASSLSSLSKSINQIAHRVNATDNIYADDMRTIKKTQEEIWRLLKSIELQLP